MARILYLDDSRAALILTERFLKDIAEVMTVTTQTEARRLIAENEIDLFLLDYVLASGNGIEFAREIRRNPAHESTPIMLITASHSEYLAYAARLAGINQSFRKPFKAEDFTKAVVEQLRSPFMVEAVTSTYLLACVTWEDNQTFYQYSPYINEVVKDTTGDGAEAKMNALLRRELLALPDKFEAVLNPQVLTQCVKRDD